MIVRISATAAIACVFAVCQSPIMAAPGGIKIVKQTGSASPSLFQGAVVQNAAPSLTVGMRQIIIQGILGSSSSAAPANLPTVTLTPGLLQSSANALGLGNRDSCSLNIVLANTVNTGSATWLNPPRVNTGPLSAEIYPAAYLQLQLPDSRPGLLYLVDCNVATSGNPLQVTVSGNSFAVGTTPGIPAGHICFAVQLDSNNNAVVQIQCARSWQLSNITVSPAI